MGIQECCICGREADEIFKAEIEGTVLDVCSGCLEYGEKVEEKKRQEIKKNVIKAIPDIKEIILVENYGKKIEEARKKIMMSRKDFARNMGEKESLIARIEKEEMKPSDKLLGKIEKFLNINLKEKYEKKPLYANNKKPELTLGDVVEVR